jgi:uncharacterized membrane protein YgcG
MNRPVRLVGLLCIILAVFPILSFAAPASQNITWTPYTESAYTLDVTTAQCRAATGNASFSATVTGVDFSTTVLDANVFATIRRPDATTYDVNFSNDLSGTYTLTTNLDQNGTYFIQARAYKTSVTPGDWNGYVYVKDLNWTIDFLNNGFDLNIGASGTIRNVVTNLDGNRVYDVNANTTIYDSNGSAVDSNAAMTQIANGEFAKTFFGPSPAGEYSVSSFFSCGPLIDHNAEGAFTVLPNGSSGSTGGTGSSGSSGSGSSGGSGGGGGSAGGGTAGKRAQITSIEFDPVLGKNAPSQMEATIQNLAAGIADYTLAYVLTTPSGLTMVGKKDIIDVGPYGTTTIIIDPAFMPLETGTYSLVAELFKINSIAKYDTYVRDYPVQGEHAIILDILPSSDKTAVGLSFPFTINLLNNGDFLEKNVQLTWYILDAKGEEYVRSTFDTELSPHESASLPYSPFVPIDSPLGLHQLVVEVHAYNLIQTKSITFTVSSPNEYYAQVISDLELRISQLDEKLDDLQQRGFDVADAKLTLLDIQTDLARAKGMLLAGEFASLNIELIDLSGRITRLAALIDALEQQSPLLSREGLNLILYIGAALLLALFAWLLFWFLEREKRERGKHAGVVLVPASPAWLMSLLHVDKCYILASEREKLKRKPLIDRIIGLIEGESSHDNN